MSASTVMVRSLMANRRQIGVPSRHRRIAAAGPDHGTELPCALCRAPAAPPAPILDGGSRMVHPVVSRPVRVAAP